MKFLYLPFLILFAGFTETGFMAQPRTPRAVMASVGYMGVDQQTLNPGEALPLSHGVEIGALIPAGASWADVGVRTFLVPAYAVINSTGATGQTQWLSVMGQGRFSTRGWLAGENPFFVPVAGIGIGVEKWSSNLSATVPLSLGTEWRIAQGLRLQLEGQYRYRTNAPATLNFTGGLAFNVTHPKAKPTTKPQPRPRQPVPAAQANRTTPATGPGDRDGDGIPDAEDKCPDQPGYIHTQGCPIVSSDSTAQVAVATTPVNPANTPPVGPSTQIGKRARNISKPDSLFLETCKTMIVFEPNSDKLSPASYATLDKIAEMMVRYPKSTLHVSGHTDNTLGSDRSLVLSVKRAYNVKYYLVYKKGIKLSRITSDGYGSDLPVADNKTPEGRRQNARVEFDLFNE